MANKKFSQFNQLSTPTANTEIVGFDGTNNVRLPASSLRGHEPFVKETFLFPMEINGIMTSGVSATRSVTSSVNYACPFMVQQDVNINKFRVNGGGSGYFVVYEYGSVLNAGQLHFTFNKVYQETNSATINSNTTVTLANPFKLEAGKVYAAAFIFLAPANVTCILHVQNNLIYTTTTNKFLGHRFDTHPQHRMTTAFFAGSMSGNNAPNSITLRAEPMAAQSFEYLELGLENA